MVPQGLCFWSHWISDSDYAGDRVDRKYSQSQNIRWDQKQSPWGTIILVLVCELDIEEYASQPYGVNSFGVAWNRAHMQTLSIISGLDAHKYNKEPIMERYTFDWSRYHFHQCTDGHLWASKFWRLCNLACRISSVHPWGISPEIWICHCAVDEFEDLRRISTLPS